MKRAHLEQIVTIATADREETTGLHVRVRDVMVLLDKAIPNLSIVTANSHVDQICAAVRAAEDAAMVALGLPYEFPITGTKPFIVSAQERRKARLAGDFVRADAIRSELAAQGICVQDAA